MKNNYTTSSNGIAFIKEFEGNILHVYADPVGLLTLGCGHLLTAAEKQTYKIGHKITEDESTAFLRKDLRIAESVVRNYVEVPITQNQFDALVSFSFNIGVEGFKRSSILRDLNDRHFDSAANDLLKYDRANGQKLAGLTRRRQAERKLFLTPDKPQQITASTDPPPSILSETPAVNSANFSVENAAPASAQNDAGAANLPPQQAENINNISNDADASKVEAAQTQPPTEIERPAKTGFGAKLTAFFTMVLTGQYVVPQFVADGANSNMGLILTFVGELFRALYENRYLVFGAIVVWVVVKKANAFFVMKHLTNINTDQTRGNIVLVDAPNKPIEAYSWMKAHLPSRSAPPSVVENK